MLVPRRVMLTRPSPTLSKAQMDPVAIWRVGVGHLTFQEWVVWMSVDERLEPAPLAAAEPCPAPTTSY